MGQPKSVRFFETAMLAHYYVDLTTRKGVEIAPGVLASNLMQGIHPFIKKAAQEGRYVAVAFPDMAARFGIGERQRWFAEQRETLEAMLDRLTSDPRFDDYWIARQIKPVPAACDRQVAYVRLRLSHALSQARAARHPRAATLDEINRKTRNKRLRHLESAPAGIGYLDLRSASTQQQFRLFVQRVEAGSDILLDENAPDSYGLSRPTQIVALPEFEP